MIRRLRTLFARPQPAGWDLVLAAPDTAAEGPREGVRGAIELITDEEVRAYLVLQEVGWAARKIARVFRRAPESVAGHIARREREIRIAREMREIRA